MTHVVAIVLFAIACMIWVIVQRASGRDAGRPCSGAGTCRREPGDTCARERGEQCPNEKR